ncbi:heterokaryon incompatibility protein-domain-containing protein, partial [Microdochium bolleyi]
MHLLNVHTQVLELFLGTSRPPYAILSHTWGDHEAKFEDYCEETTATPNHEPQSQPQPRSRQARTRRETRQAPRKALIAACCRKAIADGFNYVWVDTCCIDKRSSAELSEAINSMFRWYRESACCYVYLADVPAAPFSASARWFQRGWTLQELLAPRALKFFDAEWTWIGFSLQEVNPPQDWRLGLERAVPNLTVCISDITGISISQLQSGDLSSTCVAQRMSWASARETTREEDIAYCLLGIFDVNMPLLYGEGERAFERLQEEIIKKNSDQSIFAF